MKRLASIVLGVSLFVCLAACVLWLRSYTNDFWIQTAPPGVVYAFKVWGNEATLYRLETPSTYPNHAAAILQFHVNNLISISALIAFATGVYLFMPRRKARGLCPACGYDLRASTGRCPECGRAITTAGP